MKSFSLLTALSILVLSSGQEFSWECENVTRIQSIDLDAVKGTWYIIQEINPKDNTSLLTCIRADMTVQEEHETTSLMWSTNYNVHYKYDIIKETNNAVWHLDDTSRHATLQVMYLSTDTGYLAVAVCERDPWPRGIILHRSLEVNEADLSGIRQHLISVGFKESLFVKTVDLSSCPNIE